MYSAVAAAAQGTCLMLLVVGCGSHAETEATGLHDGGGPPSSCTVAPPYAPIEGCGACVAAECCALAERCEGSASCSTLRQCIVDCASPQCVLDCYRAPGSNSDPGYQTYLSLRSCAVEGCRAACRTGRQFACVDGYEAAAARADRGSVRLSFEAYAPGGPPADTSLAVCARGDEACTSPLQTLALNGLSVALNDLPFPFEGTVRITGTGLLPHRFDFGVDPHTGRPETMPSYNVPLVTPAFLLPLETAGAVLDDAAGHVALVLGDCVLDGAVAATFTLDGGTPISFDARGEPQLAAGATSEANPAVYGFLNVPPGVRQLVALTAAGNVIWEGSIVVEAGEVSALNLLPAPRSM